MTSEAMRCLVLLMLRSLTDHISSIRNSTEKNVSDVEDVKYLVWMADIRQSQL